jgi:hypothetical protein
MKNQTNLKKLVTRQVYKKKDKCQKIVKKYGVNLLKRLKKFNESLLTISVFFFEGDQLVVSETGRIMFC